MLISKANSNFSTVPVQLNYRRMQHFRTKKKKVFEHKTVFRIKSTRLFINSLSLDTHRSETLALETLNSLLLIKRSDFTFFVITHVTVACFPVRQ